MAGRLTRPFEAALPMADAYWIVTPHVTADLPKIDAFHTWLLAEVADDPQRMPPPGCLRP